MRHLTSFLLLVSILSLFVSGSPHIPRRRHHARHLFAKLRGSTSDLDGTIARRDDSCDYGTWRCQGAELQRCWNDTWNTMRTCTSDLVCSIDPEKTGCIWPWQADSSDSSPAALSSSSSGQGPAGTIVVTQDADTSSSSSEVAAYTTSPTQSASTTVTPESSTLTPTNPWSTIIPTVTPSIIGGALFHWQQGSSSASNSASASDSQSAISTAGQSTSWTNTWWTPSPTAEAAQSTSTTESSTSSRRRKSKTSTSTSVWGWNSQPDPSATSSSATSSSVTSSSAVTTASTSIPATGTTATLASPHYVIYSDAWLTSMPSLSDVAGYNRFLLAFWLSDRGAADNALFWSSLTTTERAAVKAEYNAAGVAVMVSAFGATDNPTTMGVDPTACAQSLAAFVKAYDLDGVDIDYEDANAFNTGVAEAWLITFQTVLRQQLPTPYIISHAPQAPWFTSTGQYTGGGYTKVHAAVGNGIDFYNIQFYNQGDIYNDCVSLISTSGGYFPSTSVFEIHSYSSVPLSKIVIGKPLDAAAASNGYMDSATLAQCVKQAKAKGWDGGVMYWEFQKSLATLSMLAVVG